MVSLYLTTQEIADMYRTSPETVRYWRHTGYGPPSFKVGRRVLYEAEQAVQWGRRQQQAGDNAGQRAG
jgi:DNA-binding transcriptional MerR regulator